MQIQSYFQLIGPLIFIVFSGGFLFISRYEREIVAARIFSISYLLAAAGFISDFTRGSVDPVITIYLSNGLYTAATALFSIALYTLYRGRSPLRVIGGICLAMFVGLTWFRFGADSIVGRTVVMNLGTFALFGYAIYDLRHLMRRPVDRVLAVLVSLNASQFLVRTVIVLWIESGVLTFDNYSRSITAVSMQFFVSALALVVAANLFMIFGMEIVTRLTVTSETDPLTGALNRRGFDRQLPELADQFAPGGPDHAVVIADIDRFKAVNDRYGHDAGDAVITHFVRLMACLAREEDLLVRWGGEEFMIVMPVSGVPAARLYAESVRSAFELVCHDSLEGKAVTASFGVAAWRRDEDIVEAVQRADDALYRAKRDGRNRVVSEAAREPVEFSAPAFA